MGIYAVFGYTPLLPKLLNISLAALCAVLTFEIARKLFGQRVAIVAALGTVFLPSLIVWSVATLKETLVLFASLLALWALQILSETDRHDRHFANALVVLLGATLLLLDLRSSSAFIVVGLLALFIVARSHVRLRAVAARTGRCGDRWPVDRWHAGLSRADQQSTAGRELRRRCAADPPSARPGSGWGAVSAARPVGHPGWQRFGAASRRGHE